MQSVHVCQIQLGEQEDLHLALVKFCSLVGRPVPELQPGEVLSPAIAEGHRPLCCSHTSGCSHLMGRGRLPQAPLRSLLEQSIPGAGVCVRRKASRVYVQRFQQAAYLKQANEPG